MKTLSASLKALVVASLACAAGLTAADTQTLTVSANVVGTCKFSKSTNLMAFGDLDQSSADLVTKKLNVDYQCTKNSTSAITIPSGALAMADSVDNTKTLPFKLTVANGAQTGGGFGSSGTVLTAELTGAITGADVQAAAAGNYSTNVTLTITP